MQAAAAAAADHVLHHPAPRRRAAWADCVLYLGVAGVGLESAADADDAGAGPLVVIMLAFVVQASAAAGHVDQFLSPVAHGYWRRSSSAIAVPLRSQPYAKAAAAAQRLSRQPWQ